MNDITTLLTHSSVHQEWQPILKKALQKVDPIYLHELLNDSQWLPGKSFIFSAFQRDLSHCRYILFGESPYPRAQSANGIAFYDAAVQELWSDSGLSKNVNKATSLRNMIKCMLLAEGHISADKKGKITQQAISVLDKSALIQHIQALFNAFESQGFLLCNTTPVLHQQRKPAAEAKYWHPFINQLLIEIHNKTDHPPTLILWGKVAELINTLKIAQSYSHIQCEHPYNISFIHNKNMLALFKHLKLLNKHPKQ